MSLARTRSFQGKTPQTTGMSRRPPWAVAAVWRGEGGGGTNEATSRGRAGSDRSTTRTPSEYQEAYERSPLMTALWTE